MSSGPSSPTSQTVTQTTIPEYLRPQVEEMVGMASGLMKGQLEGGYQPYEGQRIAGFTPMQAQAFQQLAGQQIPGQITDASNLALGAGQAAMGYGAQAAGLGQQAANIAQAQSTADRAAASQYGALGSEYGAQAASLGQAASQAAAAQAAAASGAAQQYGQLGTQYGAGAAQIGQGALNLAQSQSAADRIIAGRMGEQAQQYGAQAADIGQQGYQNAIAQAINDRALAQQYGTQAAQLGLQGVNLAGTAQQIAEQQADIYGQMGVSAGMRGEQLAGRGVSAAEQGFGAQQAYQQMATSPEATQAYMSPYMQNVVAQQQRDAIRQADIQRQANQARAVGQGAFGGSRSALVEAELQKNLAEQLGDIQATGSQQAFQQAQQAQQFGAGLGIQGLQAGYQGLQTGLAGTGQALTGAGLGLQGTGQRLAAGQLGLTGVQTGISGQQAGLSGIQAAQQAAQLGLAGAGMGITGQQAGIAGQQAGLQSVGQQIAAGQMGLQGAQVGLAGQQAGISGAQTGLQGVGQQIAAGQLGVQGAQAGLAGTAQGIQGAQAGLQGVNTSIGAGQYGLAGLQAGMAGQQAGIAGAQAGMGAAGTLGQLGGQQFSQQMAITDAMQKYGALQQAQQQQGLDVDYQNYLASQNFPYQQLGFFSDLVRGLPMSQSTSTMYGGQPAMAAQLPGLLMAGAGYFGGRKEGGQIKKYAEGGAVSPEAMTLEDARSLPSKLRRLSDTQLAAYARSVKDAVSLSSIQSELQRRTQARQPYNPNATLQPTLADQVAKRAEAATVGAAARPAGMAGGGIVALQSGAYLQDAMGNYQPTAEEMLQYQPGPTIGQAISNRISAAQAAQAQSDEEARARFLQQNAPHILSSGETIGPQGMQPVASVSPPPEAGDGETIGPQGMQGISSASTGAPAGVAPQNAPRAGAPSGIPGAGMFAKGIIPGSFEEYKAQINKAVERSPEDKKLLDDMAARVQNRIGKAAKQEDRAKYDALMMAGLAMMGGNSLADGLMKAAQTGGATFMSSNREARKAMDAAEEADIAFQKYKIALDRNDKKEAGDLFKDYSAQVLKLQEIQAKYADIGARKGEADKLRQAALDQKTEDRLRGSYNTTAANIARTEKELATEYAAKEKELSNRMLLADPKTKQEIQAQLKNLSDDYARARRGRTDPMFESLKDTAKKLGYTAPISYSDLDAFSLGSVRPSK